MARKPRQILPGLPHHIIQRGARRLPVFFKPNDYRYYLDLLTIWSKEAQLKIWAYCLMPNHVHIVALPLHEDSLRLAMSQTHKRYTNMINKREGWTGHLWQSRFLSYPVDNDPYLLSVVRYVELNPVAAEITAAPEDYFWSSAKTHIHNRKHSLLDDTELREMVPDWKSYLAEIEHPHIQERISKNSGDSYF